MPILSRRATQRIINDISQFISGDALRPLVAKLNAGNINSLDALWEIILISLLSKIGKVSYESSHGGTSRPDIHFIGKDFEMVSDITCISDQDSVKNNDIDYFVEQFELVAKKFGIKDLAGFDFRFDGTHEWRKKVKLKLPVKPATRKFIENKFKPFIQNVAVQPDNHHHIKIEDDDAVISAAFSPGKTTFSMGYPVFTQAPTPKNNVLYNRLIRKRDQLKKSGFNGIKGLFICDADCALFGKLNDEYGSYGVKSIIGSFLNNQETIGFVVMLHVKEHRSGIFGHEMNRNFEFNVYSKPIFHKGLKDFVSAMNATIAQFPRPERNAKNAINILRAGRYVPGADFYGGFRMTGEKIRISLRTVLRLISGELSHEQFLRDHDRMGAILLHKIISGYSVQSLNIIKDDCQDDDWLEFTFDETLDPALNPFTLNADR